MRIRLLTTPQLMFVAGTRAMLGAGVALLASRKLSDRKRQVAGLTLALVGAATTIPAFKIVTSRRSSLLTRMVRKLL